MKSRGSWVENSTPTLALRFLGVKLNIIGVQAQKQQSYSYITVPLVGGVLSTQTMLQFVDTAEEFGDGTICLTPYQNLKSPTSPTPKYPTQNAALQNSATPSRSRT